MNKRIYLLCILLVFLCSFAIADADNIVIFSAANTQRLEEMQRMLSEKFPEHTFVVEYLGTSKLAAKLLAEGTDTEVDIIHDLSYTNMFKLQEAGYLADLDWVDYSIYADDVNLSKNFVIEYRTSGAIVVNTKLLEEYGLPEPTSYEDLLKPEYQGLISMPDPKSSGTGYMFVLQLVNAWGEEKAFDYFGKLDKNIFQYTSGGNGPINALVQEEAAIGFCMTVNAVNQINAGDPLKILFFEEGAPFSMYGQAIPKGKEENPAIKEVFDYMIGDFLVYTFQTHGHENCIKDLVVEQENYPNDIVFGDMSNDTIEEKERLLDMWIWS